MGSTYKDIFIINRVHHGLTMSLKAHPIYSSKWSIVVPIPVINKIDKPYYVWILYMLIYESSHLDCGSVNFLKFQSDTNSL